MAGAARRRAKLLSSRSRRLAAVWGLLAFVFVLGAVVGDPAIGVSLLYLLPVLLTGLWFGPLAGLAAGLAATGLFLVGALITPQDHLMVATLLRLAVFCSAGYLVTRLIVQQVELRAAVAAREREIADLRAIREALTPAQIQSPPSLEIASCFVPAEQGVGGDFHLVAAGPDDSTIVVVGDVVGKGIEAARRASFVRATLSTFAPFTDDPCRLLQMANYSLIERAGASDVFVTAACVTFRPAERRFSWALAGHPSPIRLDNSAPLEEGSPGLPLGIQLELELDCTHASVRLERGEGLLLFTDGLTEARRSSSAQEGGPNGGRSVGLGGDDRSGVAVAQTEELFGTERVEAMLERLRHEPPAIVVRELCRAAEEFSGRRLADDLCILALRVTV